MNNGDCDHANGEGCYKDLKKPCRRRILNSGCKSNVRCGQTWGDANDKCGNCCINDGDCDYANGEECYANLNKIC